MQNTNLETIRLEALTDVTGGAWLDGIGGRLGGGKAPLGLNREGRGNSLSEFLGGGISRMIGGGGFKAVEGK